MILDTYLTCLLASAFMRSNATLLAITGEFPSWMNDFVESFRKYIEVSAHEGRFLEGAFFSRYVLVLILPVFIYFFLRSARMLYLYALQLIEFVVRLSRFILDFVAQVFWVNPRYRMKREIEYRSHANFSPFSIFLRFIRECLLIPIDWIRSLGFNGVFGPDPLTESKNYPTNAFYPSLLQRLMIVRNNHISLYFGLSLIRLFTHRLTLPVWWLPGYKVSERSHGDEFPMQRELHFFKRHDVEEVLERSEDFRVIYEPRMCDVTQAKQPNNIPDGNFLLGRQVASPAYTRDISNMRLVFRRDDIQYCHDLAVNACQASIFAFGSRLDLLHDELRKADVMSVSKDLVRPVIKSFIKDYFGITLPLEAKSNDGKNVIDFNLAWFSDLFYYIFYDIDGEKSKDAALRAAPLLNQALDRQIAAKKTLSRQALEQEDTVLSRCLLLQLSGTPGMDDLSIRVNLTGFLVGAVLPLTNTICQVIDQLMSRPRFLAQASAIAMAEAKKKGKQVANAGDPQHADTSGASPKMHPLHGFVLEALRFSPGDPVIYRHCKEKTELVNASYRTSVPANTRVMAWNSSAMFDPKYVDQPWQFNPNRPNRDYLHFGHMHHVCAGKYIVMSVIPAVLQSLLSEYHLTRIPGTCGYPMKNGITVSDFDVLVRRRPDPQSSGKSMTSTST